MAKEIKFSVKLDIDGQSKLVAATTSAKDLQKALTDAKGKAEKFNTSLLNFNQVQMAFGNVRNAISSLANAFGTFTDAANNAQIANQRLTTVMQERMNATESDVNSIKGLITQQTALGVVSGTAQKAAAQQVATFLTQKSSLEQLIPAMNNLIAQQNGVGASAESAQSIGNLFGKVMQGQTSALKRVGITFDETQEQALKFGTEEERAAVLAQVVNQNVGQMNEALGQTTTGRLSQISAKFAGLKVQIGQFLQQFSPLISAVSGIAMFAASIGGAVTAVKGLCTALWTAQARFVALAAAQVRAVAVGAALRVANFVLTGSFAATSAATVALNGALVATAGAATVAKAAIRGLLVSTGVGAVIAGLTMGVEALMNAFDKTASSAKDSTQALKDEAAAAEAANEQSNALADVQKSAATRYADERNKVKALTSAIHDNAVSYSDRLKAIKNLQAIIPSYHAQIAKDGAIFNENSAAVDNYIKKLDDLAMAEAAFDKIKELNSKVLDSELKIANAKDVITKSKSTIGRIDSQNENLINGDSNHFNRDYSTKSDATNTTTAGVPHGVYAATSRQGESAQAKKDYDSASKTLKTETEKKTTYLRDIETLKKIGGSTLIGFLANGGYTHGRSLTPSTTLNSGGHNSTGGGRSTVDTTTTETPPKTGSIEDYDKRINDLRKQAKATNDVTEATTALAEAEKLQTERDELAIKIGLEKPKTDDIEKNISQLAEKLQKAMDAYQAVDPLFVDAKINAAEDVREIAEELASESRKQGVSVTVESLLQDSDVQSTLSSSAATTRAKRSRYNELMKQGDTVNADYSSGLIDEKEAKSRISALNAEIAKISPNLEPIKLKVDADGAKKEVTDFADVAQRGWSSIKGGVGAVESVTDSLKGNESAWKKTTAVIDGAFQMYNSVIGVVSMVTTLTKALGLAKQEETNQTNASTIATASHTGTATADAAATTADTTAKAGNAMAGAAQSGASLPFPANIAAIAAGVAAVVAVIASIASLAFETGGIVPGTSPTGDKMTVRVNSGEMILNKRQQANLWRMANTRYATPTMVTANTPALNSFNVSGLRDALAVQSINVNVRGKMSGRDIKLVTDKRNTILNRS